MIPDTPEQLHLKEASELQSNVSGADSEGEKALLWVSTVHHCLVTLMYVSIGRCSVTPAGRVGVT